MSLEMLNEPISKFTNHDLTVLASELTVSDAAKLMSGEHIDSVLVFENDQITGIITIKDIITKIVAKGLDPLKISIKEIVHDPLIKINKDAKVIDAMELMNKHQIRRLIVTDDKRTIGIISRKKIIGDLHDLEIHLPELEIPGKLRCPYCSSEFKEKKPLSTHISNTHMIT